MTVVLPAGVRAHLDQDEIQPVRLFEIGGTPILYFTDYDEPVVCGGQVYQPRGISYSKTKLSVGYETENYAISMDNIDDALIGWALANDPTGQWSYVRKAWLDGAQDIDGNYEAIDDTAMEIFAGRNASASADVEFEINVKTGLDLHKQRGPRVMQHRLCRFQGQDGFKGHNCGYTGAETICNYTWERCNELENQARFGGFKDISNKQNS